MNPVPTYRYRAKINRVVDGDTIDFDIDLGFGVWLHKQRIRLARIDAPELRGEERKAGLKAKAYVEDEIEAFETVVQTIEDKKGKYGRWIAEVWYLDNNGWQCLNNNLVSKGLAKYID